MNINPEDLATHAQQKARIEDSIASLWARLDEAERTVAVQVVREINHLISAHQGPPLACKACERYVTEKFEGRRI